MNKSPLTSTVFQQSEAVQNNQSVQPKVVSAMEVEMGTSVTSNSSVVRKGAVNAGGNASSLTTGLMSGEVKPTSVHVVMSNQHSIPMPAATS